MKKGFVLLSQYQRYCELKFPKEIFLVLILSLVGMGGVVSATSDLKGNNLIAGDLNGDGKVNESDYELFSKHFFDDNWEIYPFVSDWAADVNGDGHICSPDISLLGFYILEPEKYQLRPRKCGDVNHDGKIDTEDVILLINYISSPEVYNEAVDYDQNSGAVGVTYGLWGTVQDKWYKWPLDINGDRKVNSDDVPLLSKHITNPSLYPLTPASVYNLELSVWFRASRISYSYWGRVVDDYDYLFGNHNRKIDLEELNKAETDYQAGKITHEDFQKVQWCYERGTPISMPDIGYLPSTRENEVVADSFLAFLHSYTAKYYADRLVIDTNATRIKVGNTAGDGYIKFTHGEVPTIHSIPDLEFLAQQYLSEWHGICLLNSMYMTALLLNKGIEAKAIVGGGHVWTEFILEGKKYMIIVIGSESGETEIIYEPYDYEKIKKHVHEAMSFIDENGLHEGYYDWGIVSPSVSTTNAINIQANQAILNGNLTNLGGAISNEVWFEWGLTTSYGNITAKQTKTAAGTFSADITGLTANTTYHFRAAAQNSAGISYGDDKAFTATEGMVNDFRKECLSDTTIVCNTLTLHDKWLVTRKLAQIWWEFTDSERDSIAGYVIKNWGLDNSWWWRRGQEDCKGGIGEWTSSVCLIYAMERVLKLGDSEKFYDSGDYAISSCYWKDDKGKEHCYWEESFSLPVYFGFIEVPGFMHTICAFQVKQNKTDFDSWRFFQYSTDDINPGHYQMPCSHNGNATSVVIRKPYNFWQCMGVQGDTILKWQLDPVTCTSTLTEENPLPTFIDITKLEISTDSLSLNDPAKVWIEILEIGTVYVKPGVVPDYRVTVKNTGANNISGRPAETYYGKDYVTLVLWDWSEREITETLNLVDQPLPAGGTISASLRCATSAEPGHEYFISSIHSLRSGSKKHDSFFFSIGVLGSPSVEINDATNIQTNQATLNGNLTNLGNATSVDVWFEWGLTTSYGNITAKQTKTAAGTLSADITGLTANTTYHFRAAAQNSAGTVYGSDKSFTTLPAADTTAPAKVTNLAASNPTANSIALSWTAPGDDGSAGTASQYDIRYSTSIIDTDAKFNSATQATGEPAPKVAGSAENFTVTGLSPNTTYYFALKTADKVPNWSSLSNIATSTTLLNIGTISGTVTNTTGAPIEGATVQADGYSNTTNLTGNYRTTIPVGNYTVTASKTGYQSQSKNATVLANMTTEVNFTLMIETTTTTTTTSTTTTTTSTTSTTTSTTSTSTTTTTTTLPCTLPGDYPTCGEVVLAEVVDFIILWSQDLAALEDVINLINAWAAG